MTEMKEQLKSGLEKVRAGIEEAGDDLARAAQEGFLVLERAVRGGSEAAAHASSAISKATEHEEPGSAAQAARGATERRPAARRLEEPPLRAYVPDLPHLKNAASPEPAPPYLPDAEGEEALPHAEPAWLGTPEPETASSVTAATDTAATDTAATDAAAARERPAPEADPPEAFDTDPTDDTTPYRIRRMPKETRRALGVSSDAELDDVLRQVTRLD